MQQEGHRFCDICEEEISKGKKYRRITMREKAAAQLLARDPETTPTFEQDLDGNIMMDICLICSLSMGEAPSRDEMS